MSTPQDAHSPPPSNGVVSPPRAILRPFVPRFVLSILNIHRSLWRVLALQDPPPDPQLAPPPAPPHRLSTLSLTSLTSSRPAPPSPAVSRRASGLSRPSSRPTSGASSRPSSGVSHSRPASGAPQTTSPIAMTTATASPTTPRNPHDRPPTLVPAPDATPAEPHPTPTAALPTASPFIQIRDYGFTQADPRFAGQGPHVPRANRPTILARRLAATTGSTPTSSTEGDNGDDDDEYEDADDEGEGESEQLGADVVHGMWQDAVEDGANGWHGFQWGGFGRAWGFRPTSGVAGADFPSRGELDRNFGGEDEEVGMVVDEPFSDEEGLGGAESEPLLWPGIYRAMYAFEPEGTAEMKLDEDQVVRVIGRGGGVGWAVVVKDGLKDTGVHALVPESYLELVRLDGAEEDLES